MSMSFPEWVEPVAATLTQERFTGPEWDLRAQFDGIRLLGFQTGNGCAAVVAQRLPELPPHRRGDREPSLRDVIFDGEVTWGKAGMCTTCSISCGSMAAT